MKTFVTEPETKIIVSFLTILLIGFSSTDLYSQCSAPTLKFHSPVLIAGTDGQVGAIYQFAEVIPGVDAHIEIAGIYGGATLYNIDDSAGIGYYDAFQPYVGAAPNDTSYLDWKITFKIGGTNIDTALPCLAVTGVDVDGDGAYLQEFIEAATPGSIAVDPATILHVSFDGVRSKAISTIYNIPLIDSSHHEAMFQMNFVNISTLLYRNGAVSTYSSQQVRQTCIYFKPFFHASTFQVLPVTLHSFDVKDVTGFTEIDWLSSNEQKVLKYTVQKSSDGKNWKEVQSLKPATSVSTGKTESANKYTVKDYELNAEEIFYRLKIININGFTEYSQTIHHKSNRVKNAVVTHNTFVNNEIMLQIAATKNDNYLIQCFDAVGAGVQQQRVFVTNGINRQSIRLPSFMSPGPYIMVISNQNGERMYSARLIKQSH